MQIFVKLLSGLTVTFDVEGTDTVSSLKQKIKAKQNIEPGDQRLVYSGNNLEDGRTLADYDIPKEATLYLITSAASAKSSILAPPPPAPAPAPIPRAVMPSIPGSPSTQPYVPPPPPYTPVRSPVPQDIQVTVQTTTADRHIFNVNTNTTVRTLMNMVIDKTGGSQIELCLGSKVLNPGNTLEQEGVRDQALLRVVTHTKGGYSI